MADIFSSPAIFLQPHADDAALSCGGTVANVVAAGQAAQVITIFAGEIVPQMVGPFAQSKHDRWKLPDANDVVETRRAEDAEACRIMGCSVRWLGMPDAIYRGDTVESNEELFGEPDKHALELAQHLADELANLPEWRDDATVYVPLGIGNHLDHQIAFETGCELAKRGQTVFAWEDAPYAIHTPSGVDTRLGAIGSRIGSEFVLGIGETIERKIAAISAYRSQVPVIFRYTGDFAQSIRDFARATGGGRLAERFWPVSG